MNPESRREFVTVSSEGTPTVALSARLLNMNRRTWLRRISVVCARLLMQLLIVSVPLLSELLHRILWMIPTGKTRMA